jgi:glycerol kinase
MNRKASITGMSFGTTKNHIVRAALESIPFQIKDVITAMEKDAGLQLQQLNTDGGMTSNEWLMFFIADILNKQVKSIGMPDVSALGAAYLAGLKAGLYKNLDQLKEMNANNAVYQPTAGNNRQSWYIEWQKRIVENKF